MELMELTEHKVQWDLMGHKVHKVKEGLMERKEYKVQEDLMEPMGLMELKVQQVLV